MKWKTKAPLTGLLVVVGIMLLACTVMALECPDKANVVNAVAVSLTGIAVIFYIHDTHRIAEATEETLESAGRPRINLALAAHWGENDIKAQPGITNKSGFFCEVRTRFAFTVYGQAVLLTGHYSGETPWDVMPETTNYGVFSVSQVLAKAGKTLQEVMNDQSRPENEKLSVEIMLTARGYPGSEISYPRPLKWYLVIETGKQPQWVYMS